MCDVEAHCELVRRFHCAKEGGAVEGILLGDESIYSRGALHQFGVYLESQGYALREYDGDYIAVPRAEPAGAWAADEEAVLAKLKSDFALQWRMGRAIIRLWLPPGCGRYHQVAMDDYVRDRGYAIYDSLWRPATIEDWERREGILCAAPHYRREVCIAQCGCYVM